MTDWRYSSEIIKRWKAGVPVRRILLDLRSDPLYPARSDHPGVVHRRRDTDPPQGYERHQSLEDDAVQKKQRRPLQRSELRQQAGPRRRKRQPGLTCPRLPYSLDGYGRKDASNSDRRGRSRVWHGGQSRHDRCRAAGRADRGQLRRPPAGAQPRALRRRRRTRRHRVGGRHERAPGRRARRRWGDPRRGAVADRLSSSAATAACRRSPSTSCRSSSSPHRARWCTGSTRRPAGRPRVRRHLADGPNAGQVVARQPVADPSLYLELPIGTFGSTADGVVDRVRQPGAVMIGHVDCPARR